MATIELHTWGTPNGRKVSIMLEECGLPYSVHKVDISKGEQHKPEFLRISPNNRIPAIVDPDGPGRQADQPVRIGRDPDLPRRQDRPVPARRIRRRSTRPCEWLMWQMGGVGPMFGQAHHFLRAAPTKIEYGIKRYVDEAKRLYGVLDKQLASNAFAAGADYTIADMAIFPWAARHEWHPVNLADFPNVKRWYDIDQCPARGDQGHGGAVPQLSPREPGVLLLRVSRCRACAQPAQPRRSAPRRSSRPRRSISISAATRRGRRGGRGGVGRFLDDEVTPRFPDGLSVLDVAGQYRDPSGRIVRETQQAPGASSCSMRRRTRPRCRPSSMPTASGMASTASSAPSARVCAGL